MIKIVILAISSKYVHSPLAAWVLAGGVARYALVPHDVQIVEANINQTNDDIAKCVVDFAPDVVGISTYIWNAGKLPELLKLLREMLPSATFVLGGPEASHNAEYWLDAGACFVLPGEGERSFPMLLDSLAEGKSSEIEAALLQPTCVSEQIDPYNDAYISTLKGKIAYLETSRGCPFRCTFCLSGGSGVSFFPIDIAKEQIYRLSKSGARTIKLVDRTFNCDSKRAYELFEYIIGLDTTRTFHFEVAADLFDERTLSLLRLAPPGRIQFEAGLQSFFEPTLKAASRQTDLKSVERNIRAILQGGNIHLHVDLIAGLPYETLSDFQRSFGRAYALRAHTLQLGFLKLLHGSRLRKQAEAFEIQYSAEPPYEFQGSPWLSARDLPILKQVENALKHTYNKGRFLSTLEYVMLASGVDAFSLFREIGEIIPNNGMDLVHYAQAIYNYFTTLPDVDRNKLKDCMICDWLSMVKGKNTPPFLKNDGGKHVPKMAEQLLGRKIARGEFAVLLSGAGVFVDSEDRDKVTGLYRLHFVDILN